MLDTVFSVLVVVLIYSYPIRQPKQIRVLQLHLFKPYDHVTVHGSEECKMFILNITKITKNTNAALQMYL